MSNKVKDIDTRNHTYYFFYYYYIINVENFDPIILILLKVTQRYFYLLYLTCDDKRFKICENNGVNPLYLTLLQNKQTL